MKKIAIHAVLVKLDCEYKLMTYCGLLNSIAGFKEPHYTLRFVLAARHFTFRIPLSTQVYMKWVADKMLSDAH